MQDYRGKKLREQRLGREVAVWAGRVLNKGAGRTLRCCEHCLEGAVG